LTRVQYGGGTELIAVDLITTGNVTPTPTGTPTPTASPTPCYDFDASGRVDAGDLERVSGHWRQRESDPGWDPRFDLDDDGRVTVVDIMWFAARWGQPCQ